MHHIKKAPLAFAVMAGVLALVALGIWAFEISTTAAVIGGHAVLLVVIGALVWSRHRHTSRSEPPAA